jgi:HEAT repeat protein
LGEYGNPRAVEPLIEILRNDNSDEVRHSAAYALGKLRDPRAYDVLIEALNDTYEQVRAYAATALGNLRDKRAIDALKKATQDDHQVVKQNASWALGWIENSET